MDQVGTAPPPVEVLTVGHAIVDVLADATDATVAGFGLTKATMTLVDEETSARLYDQVGPGTRMSGGSAANTAVGLASLGSRAGFLGKVADDELGTVFAADITAAGVAFEVPPGSGGPGTGRCIVLVTPDAEKTMCTNLGIGSLLDPSDVDWARVAEARVVYVEGYLCGPERTEATVEAILVAAARGGTAVALSLSDPAWVAFQGPALNRLVDQVSMVFANEDEACGLVGTDDAERALAALGERCPTVVVTRGAAGCLVATEGTRLTIPAEDLTTVVDTTGAGDLFAAGYLHGWLLGEGPDVCARLGSIAAAEVVGHLGARPQRSLAQLVEAQLVEAQFVAERAQRPRLGF